MNQARSRVKVPQIAAELSEDTGPIDPGAYAQGLKSIFPLFYDLLRNGFSWFENTNQEAVYIFKNFLVRDGLSSQSPAHFQKSLHPGG